MTTQEPKFSALNETNTTDSKPPEGQPPKLLCVEGVSAETTQGRFLKLIEVLSRTFNEAHPDDVKPGRIPEEYLLLAILNRAIFDAIHSPQMYPGGKNQKRRLQENALQWIKADCMYPFSFLWVVQHIMPDADPVALQKKTIEFCVCPDTRRDRILSHYGRESLAYMRTRPRSVN